MEKPPHTFLYWSLKYHHFLTASPNPPTLREPSGTLCACSPYNITESGEGVLLTLYPSSWFPLVTILCHTSAFQLHWGGGSDRGSTGNSQVFQQESNSFISH